MKCVSFFVVYLVFFLGLLFSGEQVIAAGYSVKPVDLYKESYQPVGQYIRYYHETLSVLKIEDAINIFSEGKFTQSSARSLNFGIGSNPVWLQLDAENSVDIDLIRRLSIETSWLDNIDVYFISQGQQPVVFHAGDSRVFSARLIYDRFFQFDYAFKPGMTSVFIRVQTPDPLVLPVYLNSIDATYSRQLTDSYTYGFLYGGIFVLMAYNLMLYFSLRNLKYLLYSLYLSFFMLTNFSYTGHAYKYLWPDSPHWQLWSNPVLMILYSVSGLMFALRFLHLKTNFPQIYRNVIYLCLAVFLFLIFAILTSSHQLALLIAFSFILLFSVCMPMLGVISLLSGNKSAKYFLIATVIHAFAAGITAMVVWSLIPYSVIGYRAIDIGMMMDAILIAMALAYQFRMARDEKLQAEKLAQVDPLTQLNNRRAFHNYVASMWSNSVRYHHNVSVIIIDIDHFKNINDTYGHAQGDDVLVEVASTLKNGIRSGDILARWGGEEFIIFLPDTTRREAALLAQRFCNSIEKLRIKTSSKTISLTISIGVADNEFNTESLDKMITEADGHLYRAKDLGRNRVVVAEPT